MAFGDWSDPTSYIAGGGIVPLGKSVMDWMGGGSVPGASFDPTRYLDVMAAIDQQIQDLYKQAPSYNALSNPTYSYINSMLAPAPGGGLGKPLQGQYDAGSLVNAMNASKSKAEAMTGAQGRNLAGSSIEAQGVENAQMQETLANSSLLASLYGMQNQNTNNLSSLLSGAVGQNNSLIASEAGALGGISGQYQGLAGMGLGENYQSALAQYQNRMNLRNALISGGMGIAGAGVFGAMMPSVPGAGGGAGMPAYNGLGGSTAMMGLPGMPGGAGGGASYGISGYNPSDYASPSIFSYGGR